MRKELINLRRERYELLGRIAKLEEAAGTRTPEPQEEEEDQDGDE